MAPKKTKYVEVIMISIYLVCAFQGLCNFEISSALTVKHKFQFKYFSIFWLMFYVIYFVLNIPNILTYYLRSWGLVSIEFFLYWFVSLTSFLITFIKQPELQLSTEEILKEFRRIPRIYNETYWLVLPTVITTVGLLSFFTISSHFSRGQPDESWFAVAVYTSFCCNTLFVVLLFSNNVYIIFFIFKNLNRELEDIVSIGPSVVDKEDASRRIRLCAKRHLNACELVHRENTLFGAQILLFTALCFVEFVYSLYTFSYSVTKSENSLFLSLLLLLSWFPCYASQIMVVAWTCDFTAKEANRFGSVAHKLINFTNEFTIKQELEIISYQSLHSKISFTALGFFTIDWTLLFYMISGVASSVTVLIQLSL